MKKEQIQEIITRHLNADEIFSQEIIINEWNLQIEIIRLTFKEGVYPDMNLAGKIMDDIDELTRNDGYGDMTEATFEYSTYATNDCLCSFTFAFNIDS